MSGSNIIPNLAVLIVAVVEILKKLELKWFKQWMNTDYGPRITSVLVGGILGLLCWIGSSSQDWRFIIEMLGIPMLQLKWFVFVLQGVIAGLIGTFGVAVLNDIAKKAGRKVGGL